MFKKILTILFLILSISSFSQTLDLSEKDKREARNQSKEIAKQTCISFWTEPNEKIKILNDLGISLDEQCRCTEDAMNYLVSDDLAAYTSHGLYEVRKKGFENIDSILKVKIDEHIKLTFVAMQGCSSKLKKR